MRVALLSNVLSPYRVPLFDELARTPGWEFCVFVNADNEFDRRWRGVEAAAQVRRMRSFRLRRRVVTRQPVRCEQLVELHVPVSLSADLRRFAPDVVISLELGPRTVAAAWYCARAGIPLISWSYQSRAAGSMTGWLRRLARRFLVRRCAAFVGMGIQAREVLERAGAPRSLVFDAPNAPDHVAIGRRLEAPEARARADAIRARFGGDRLVVVVGRLVPMKAAPQIVRVWRGLDPADRAGWRLVFVGDGPLASHVRGQQEYGIHHVGQVEPSDVVDWFAAADLHLFASLVDVWGLVVTESMLCGTPTLCSIHAGCSDDTIDDGTDGWLFDPTDEPDWLARLSGVLRRRDLEQVGERARASARRFRVERMAHGFRAAVAAACAEDTRSVEAHRLP